jgi:hypothetical protein
LPLWQGIVLLAALDQVAAAAAAAYYSLQLKVLHGFAAAAAAGLVVAFPLPCLQEHLNCARAHGPHFALALAVGHVAAAVADETSSLDEWLAFFQQNFAKQQRQRQDHLQLSLLALWQHHLH